LRADTPNSDSCNRIPKRRALIFATVGVVLIVVFAVTFFGVGRWLVAETALEKSEAIVVLSGGMPQRALEAARLFRAGYAPQVWLTSPVQPAESLDPMGIPNSGEDYFNNRVLEYEGVPTSAIHVLEPRINNTADEVRAIAAEAVRKNAANVIIVTSKVHTRRVAQLWHQLSPGHTHAIVRGASTDQFDGAHWWRNTHDALDVVREALGLLNAWAGLPLQAAR
jgi:uncharacterized SAM-binding protein YcdF (DUF218 family)